MADPIRDLWALTKPSIVRMCLVTTVGGLLLAPGEIDLVGAIAAVVGTGLAVGGANVFNMWWERDLDAKMARTKRRPLPARRLPPTLALR
ncbi:MAG TPA: UbiA family prenyltransferase, partial [Nannocystaceae bacterium]|nr:UbiA family prenyltransferase [Nannocystaceae bacterium]